MLMIGARCRRPAVCVVIGGTRSFAGCDDNDERFARHERDFLVGANAKHSFRHLGNQRERQSAARRCQSARHRPPNRADYEKYDSAANQSGAAPASWPTAARGTAETTSDEHCPRRRFSRPANGSSELTPADSVGVRIYMANS